MEKCDGFAFKELEVWKKAIKFADLVIGLVEKLETDRKHFRLIEQLEAASASVAMNIAEGKGRYSKKEFVQFLYIARGSLYETITLLAIFEKRGWCDPGNTAEITAIATDIGKMINGLINSIKKSIT